ncbi:molybdopterin-guanine dinucleotide biosynthesis protein B [Chitinimonas lacunae]|uniref:Molybdopterin-guanine dinucleotide biosynthesis protein B n=1 Tax=Chitinimonas lacunae TaxID=1963018 RepID=A0ABV8MP06_9NEIS
MNRAFGIVGWSGSGKTTLIESLLPLLRARGLKVNVIKHSHHDLVLEPPGKDSVRFREAGAAEVLIASPFRFALIHELRDEPEPSLAEQLARLAPADLTLVEGFKEYPIPKLEVYRPALGKPMLAQTLPGILAVASDAPLDDSVATLDLNRPEVVMDFILEKLAHHVQH